MNSIINSPTAVPFAVINVKTKFSLGSPESGLRRTPRLPVPTDSEKLYAGCSNPKINPSVVKIMICMTEGGTKGSERREREVLMYAATYCHYQ